MYIYVGILPLILALFGILFSSAPYRRFFTGLLILSSFYVLGNSSILHGLLYSMVPYIYLARLALRAHFILHFSLAVLAGYGTEHIITLLKSESPDQNALMLLRKLSWFALLVAAIVLFLLLNSYIAGDLAAKSHVLNDAVLFVMWLGLSVGVLYAGVKLRLPPAGLEPLVVAILVLDLFSPINSAMPLKRTFDGAGNMEPEQFYKKDQIVDRLLSDKDKYFRVILTPQNVPTYGDAFSIFTLNGVSPTKLERYFTFRSAGWLDINNLNLLNVKYIASEQNVPGWEKAAEGAKYSLYQNRDYLPRAFFVSSARFVDSDQACLALIHSREFDPKAAIVFVAGTDLSPAAAAGTPAVLAAKAGHGPASPVTIEKYTPGEIAMRVNATENGYLFLSEVWYPGWKAEIDGQPTPIYRADFLFRAVALSNGEHKVSMVYSPRSFKVGLILTCIGLLAWLGLAGIVWRRRRIIG